MEVLHDPADEAEKEEHIQVAPIVGALIGGDGDDRENEGEQDFRPQLGNLGDPAAAGEADSRRKHLRKRKAPDDQVSEVQVRRRAFPDPAADRA